MIAAETEAVDDIVGLTDCNKIALSPTFLSWIPSPEFKYMIVDPFINPGEKSQNVDPGNGVFCAVFHNWKQAKSGSLLVSNPRANEKFIK